MAIQWQNIEIPLGGVDKYTDSPHAVLGTLETAENVRFRNPNTLAKRYSWAGLTTLVLGATWQTTKRIVPSATNLMVAGQSHLFAYAESGVSWVDCGNLSDCHLSRYPVQFDQARAIADADIAVNGHCAVVVYGGEAAAPQGQIVDLRTDTIVGTMSLYSGVTTHVSAGGYARAVALGNYIYVFGWDGASGGLNYAAFDVTGSSWTFGTVASSLPLTYTYATGTQYDVCPYGTTGIVIAFKQNTGAPAVEFLTATAGALTSTANVSLADTMDSAIAVECAGSGEDIYVVYSKAASGTRYAVLDGTMTVVAGLGNINATVSKRIGIARVSATSRLVVMETPATLPLRNFTEYCTLSSTGSVSSAEQLYDWWPCSKPFAAPLTGQTVGLVGYASDNADVGGDQYTFALVEYTEFGGALMPTPRWIGTASRGLAGLPVKDGFLPSVAKLTNLASVWEIAQPSRYRFRFSGDSDETIIHANTGIVRLRWDFGTGSIHQSAPWGRGRFFAGARPSFFDGSSVAEHGFSVTHPERFSAASMSYSGQLTGSTIYKTAAVLEAEDSSGNVVRSAPVVFDDYTTAAGAYSNGEITRTLYEALLTARVKFSGFYSTYTNVRVIPYRSTGGASAAGTTLYRDSVNGFSADYNTPIYWGRTYDDAELILQDVLYTTGDILDNTGTPPCKGVVRHSDRLFLFGCEDREWIWFSQPLQEHEQPRFNEALRVFIGSDVVAMASLGDTLVALTADSIYAISGDGPPATGGLDVGFRVETIAADSGCSEPRSVLETPVGVFFQSTRGLYLLGLDRSVKWVGAQLKRLFESDTAVNGAALNREETEAVFSLYSAGSGNAYRIVYNYALERWTVDVHETRASALAECRHGGRGTIAYHEPVGDVIRVMNVGSWANDAETNANYFPAVRVVTPWIKLNTLQGWQRMRKILLMARLKGDHGLTIEVAYDYDETTWAETFTWTSAELAALAREQVEAFLARQKCQAVRFRITEIGVFDEMSEAYTPSQGPELVSLVCEGGFKGRVNRLDDGMKR